MAGAALAQQSAQISGATDDESLMVAVRWLSNLSTEELKQLTPELARIVREIKTNENK